MPKRLPNPHDNPTTNRAAEKKKLFDDMIDKVLLGAVFLIFTFRSTNIWISLGLGLALIAWGVIPYLMDRLGK